MYVPVDAWLRAFLLTLAVELPIVLALLRGRQPGSPRLAALLVFANLATHLVVWFVFPQLLYTSTAEYLAVAESWAVLAEAVFLWLVVRGLSPLRAAAAALVANAASFLVGLAVTAVWPGAFY